MFRAFLRTGIFEGISRKLQKRGCGEFLGKTSRIRRRRCFIKQRRALHHVEVEPVCAQCASASDHRSAEKLDQLPEIMDSGKILLVNLSKGMLGELDAQLWECSLS